MCAAVLAVQGLRLEGAGEQLSGSLGSFPSGRLARCGAGLDTKRALLGRQHFSIDLWP